MIISPEWKQHRSVMLGEVNAKPFCLYLYKCSHRLDLLSDSSQLTELINNDYSPRCFVIIGLKGAEEQSWAKDQCHHYSPSPPSSGDCGVELLMQLHTGSLSNTRFSAQRLFFAFSHPFSCRANRLSALPSEDIHQRNVSPPSLVTPASLCQLSKTQNQSRRLQHVLLQEAFTWRETATHQQQLCIYYSSSYSNSIPKYSPWASAAPCAWGSERFNGTPPEIKLTKLVPGQHSNTKYQKEENSISTFARTRRSALL